MIAYARAAFADFLNASPDEVIFGQNMTSLTFHLSRALGRCLSAGDEIIVTELDHHANVDPWRALERERGVIIRVLPLKAKRCGVSRLCRNGNELLEASPGQSQLQ